MKKSLPIIIGLPLANTLLAIAILMGCGHAAPLQPAVARPTVVLAVTILESPHLTLTEPIRLYGIQAADVPKEAKAAATVGLESLLAQYYPKDPAGRYLVTAGIRGKDKYGRLLGTLYGWNPDAKELLDLNAAMLSHGYAVPWDGQGVKPEPAP